MASQAQNGATQDLKKVVVTNDPLPPSSSPPSLHEAVGQHLELQGIFESAVSKRKHRGPASAPGAFHGKALHQTSPHRPAYSSKRPDLLIKGQMCTGGSGRQDPIKVTETHDPLPPSPPSPDSLRQAAEWQHLNIKQGLYNSAVSKRKNPRPATTNTTAHIDMDNRSFTPAGSCSSTLNSYEDVQEGPDLNVGMVKGQRYPQPQLLETSGLRPRNTMSNTGNLNPDPNPDPNDCLCNTSHVSQELADPPEDNPGASLTAVFAAAMAMTAVLAIFFLQTK